MNPTNPLVGPMLTDLYQLTMAYAYWRAGKQDQRAVFDLFYRTRPFGGTYAIFAGLEECLRFLEGFRFTDADLAYLRQVMPRADPRFFDWLRTVDCSRSHGVGHGGRVAGLPACADGAGGGTARHRPASRDDAALAGQLPVARGHLRVAVPAGGRVGQDAPRVRSQARAGAGRRPVGVPYAILGGFDATSNVLAGKLFDVFVRGTHAHAYVESFRGLSDLKSRRARRPGHRHGARLRRAGPRPPRRERAAATRTRESWPRSSTTRRRSPRASWRSSTPTTRCTRACRTSSAWRSPSRSSGTAPLGIRLDSGDLAYLSNEARRMFGEARAAPASVPRDGRSWPRTTSAWTPSSR